MAIPIKYILTADAGNNKVAKLILDAHTNALATIEYEHHEIHNGNFYTTCKTWTLPAGASSNILIATGNTTKHPHLIYQSISDDVLTVNFYESPDYSGGTALVAYNRDRNSSNTSGATLTYDATDDGSGKGTLIWTFKAGANKIVTASESQRFEFILKQNTKYLLENVGAQNDLVTTLLDWYEHVPRN